MRARSSALLAGGGEFRAAILESSLAIIGDQAFDGFGECRKSRFRVGRHRQIHFGKSLEILIIAFHDRDRPRVMLITFALSW